MMSTDFGKRLVQARLHAGLTQGELAKLAGMAQSTLASAENRGFGSRKTPQLAAACGVNPHWLATGDGEMLGLPEPAPVKSKVNRGTKGLVPLISWVQAGIWAETCDVLEPHEAERWLECPVPHSQCTAALRVRGDSMTAASGGPKTYPEGVIIYVDFEKKSPFNGQRIVAKLSGGDGVTFKVFKDEDGQRWLLPLNPMHKPIYDEFKVLGTVIGKWEDE